MKCTGVTVHSYPGRYNSFVWAMVDECVLISPNRNVVERAVTARRTGTSLADRDAFQRLAARLPDRNNGLACFSVGAMMRAGLGEMPPELQRWCQGLAIGAALTTGDGLVELTCASSKELSLHDFIELIAVAVFKRMVHARGGGPR